MDDFNKLIEDSLKAEKIYEKLKVSQSMDYISDTVEGLSEDMAKLVLRKFIYSRGQINEQEA